MDFKVRLCGNQHVALSRKIAWSQLAKVGKAPAMRLTVLVPFIGVFLLFNEQTEKLFQFPEFFREDIGAVEDGNLPASNLYFTYFGLCFLGMASALFAALCPREIGDQPSQQAFVMEATSLETPVLAKASFRKVLDLHFANEFNENCLDNPEYPDDLESDFHALMEGMYSQYEIGEDVADDLPEVMMATGYLDFTEFARMLWNNPRVVWVYTLPFFEIAPRYAKDISFVKYKALDHTKYVARCLIAGFYLLGFALLLIPTMKVFFLLSYGVLFG